ncbi:MAG: hypothetical protein KAQ71_09295 [Desulfobulbaceae bacterium]|nr:hypothetical protein [Desulfobulbaceae bacterium]
MGKKKNIDKLEVETIVPNHIQDCHINGAYINVTPRFEIYMHCFSERHPLPTRTIYKDDHSDDDFAEEERQYSADIERKIQASLVMELETAIELRDQLSHYIDRLIERAEKSEKEAQKSPTPKKKAKSKK